MNTEPILFRGRKYRLARREQKSLKTYFGRVLRDVERKLHSIDSHKNYKLTFPQKSGQSTLH